MDIIRNITHAPVAIGYDDADSLRTGKGKPLQPLKTKGKFLSRLASYRVQGFRPFEPEILVRDSLRLEPFGVNGQVIHTPGHTMGSLSVCLEDGKIIAGELVMSFFTRTRPEKTLYAEDPGSLKTSLEWVLKREPTTLYAGHGGPFNFSSLSENIQEILDLTGWY